MKYLLDTHAFLWTASESKLLPDKIAKIIRNPKNGVFVSAVTFWEIAIKSRIGKLNLDGLMPDDLPPIAEEMEIQMIGLTPEEAVSYCNLKGSSYNDPFDRMLIWQAIRRDMVVISKDWEVQNFIKYGLKLVW